MEPRQSRRAYLHFLNLDHTQAHVTMLWMYSIDLRFSWWSDIIVSCSLVQLDFLYCPNVGESLHNLTGSYEILCIF